MNLTLEQPRQVLKVLTAAGLTLLLLISLLPVLAPPAPAILLVLGSTVLACILTRSSWIPWTLGLIYLLFWDGYLTPSHSSIILWGLLGIFLLSQWAQAVLRKTTVKLEAPIFWSLIVGWLVLGGIAVLYSPDRTHSLKEMCRYAFGLSVMFTYIQWLRDPAIIQRVLRLIWIALVVYALLMLIEAILPRHPNPFQSRVFGPYPHVPAESGIFLCTFFGVFLSLGRRLFPSRYMIPGIGLMLIGVVLSDSQSALVAALISLCAIYALEYPRSAGRVMVYTAILVGGLLLLGSFYIPDFGEKLLHPLSGREKIWGAALSAVAAHPLTGVGPGNWQTWFGDHYLISDFILTDMHGNFFALDPARLGGEAHNLFLTKAAEMGVPATLFLTAAFAAWFWHGWRVFRSLPPGWSRDLVRGALASFLGLFVISLFENGPLIGTARDAQVLLVMLVLALPAVVASWETAPGSPRQVSLKGPKVILARTLRALTGEHGPLRPQIKTTRGAAASAAAKYSGDARP